MWQVEAGDETEAQTEIEAEAETEVGQGEVKVSGRNEHKVLNNIKLCLWYLFKPKDITKIIP